MGAEAFKRQPSEENPKRGSESAQTSKNVIAESELLKMRTLLRNEQPPDGVSDNEILGLDAEAEAELSKALQTIDAPNVFKRKSKT